MGRLPTKTAPDWASRALLRVPGGGGVDHSDGVGGGVGCGVVEVSDLGGKAQGGGGAYV